MNNYFEEWSYKDIQSKDLDAYGTLMSNGIINFKSLQQQQLINQTFKEQAISTTQQVEKNAHNLHLLQESRKDLANYTSMIQDQIENMIEVENQTTKELSQLKQGQIQPISLDQVNQIKKLMSQKQELQSKIDFKRDQLFGQGFKENIPRNTSDIIKLIYTQKAQLAEIQSRIAQKL
ncbi:hypothetical protein pb186bvf_002302 [Paramecium bursaria]